MGTQALIRGWLEMGDEQKRKLVTLIEAEKRKCEKTSPDLLSALNCWVFPDVPEKHDFFAFLGVVVHISRLDFFRELFRRVATDVWDGDFGYPEKYYIFGIFHVNTDDGQAFRWRLRHGQFEELPGSEIACGMG